ncbi:hypothetical protein GGR56DRAFT_670985 [Xylariaceae sp. FL0804]|nr:hypothetical protein GGR56DRAFT_670985 [Xylariaceae sp. FL0804]
MCFVEYVGYTCGHTSCAVHRPCPLTTHLHSNPCCPNPAVRPFLVADMCHACSRILHGRWVDILEWEHQFLHSRGACACDAVFPALQHPRAVGPPAPGAGAAADINALTEDDRHHIALSSASSMTERPDATYDTPASKDIDTMKKNQKQGTGQQGRRDVAVSAPSATPSPFAATKPEFAVASIAAPSASRAAARTAPPLYQETEGADGTTIVGVATRLPSTYAAEWTADHAALHASGRCRCAVDFAPYAGPPNMAELVQAAAADADADDGNGDAGATLSSTGSVTRRKGQGQGQGQSQGQADKQHKHRRARGGQRAANNKGIERAAAVPAAAPASFPSETGATVGAPPAPAPVLHFPGEPGSVFTPGTGFFSGDGGGEAEFQYRLPPNQQQPLPQQPEQHSRHPNGEFSAHETQLMLQQQQQTQYQQQPQQLYGYHHDDPYHHAPEAENNTPYNTSPPAPHIPGTGFRPAPSIMPSGPARAVYRAPSSMTAAGDLAHALDLATTTTGKIYHHDHDHDLPVTTAAAEDDDSGYGAPVPVAAVGVGIVDMPTLHHPAWLPRNAPPLAGLPIGQGPEGDEGAEREGSAAAVGVPVGRSDGDLIAITGGSVQYRAYGGPLAIITDANDNIDGDEDDNDNPEPQKDGDDGKHPQQQQNGGAENKKKEKAKAETETQQLAMINTTPVAGFPLGAGPEGVPHAAPFGAGCALNIRTTRRRDDGGRDAAGGRGRGYGSIGDSSGSTSATTTGDDANHGNNGDDGGGGGGGDM